MAERMIQTPLGPITLTASDGAITALDWREGACDGTPELCAAEVQLGEYFAGTRRDFDLPLHVAASEFQQRICARMQAIPFGETVTYGDLARELGAPAQAIGTGCGGNPIAIIIPCHRVLGATSLGGFSAKGGVETKVWLLRHEGAAGLLI
ncbi:methylated-DNA--[protein]-cysteine S-methyltransferase [Roseovarius sp. C7]|uniref:methylated-DNA--[protein]-cysteine S-methyltransferase n=1 Tax=Roseovarius sp. C7 TaxID=3398643 RepID=UPI0039F64FBF